MPAKTQEFNLTPPPKEEKKPDFGFEETATDEQEPPLNTKLQLLLPLTTC